ncbi:MAG: alanine dehydrogenase, partial [Muribaculaceae bacterium]|nr:alanine dehydrogenase [Muribaculaceae bacterium]
MKIGIPKEIKNNENRVGATPAGVKELVAHGHEVFVQHTAGEGSGFPDEEYEKAGATILPTIEDVYATGEMIIKVKEPIAPEYPLVRKGQV